jgi:superfamily I DNA and/or RNA helicase
MAERLWWLDHTYPEEKPDSQSAAANSYSNLFEIDMVMGLVRYLIRTGEYDLRDIAILTPYNGQLAEFAVRLRGTCSLWLSEKDRQTLIDLDVLNSNYINLEEKTQFPMTHMLRLATIDSFQGEEAKIVILSTVRSNSENRVGFLKTDNRINVACSRARNGLYIVGNSSLMKRVPMWRTIIDHLKKRSKIGPAFQTCCSRHGVHNRAIKRGKDFEKIPICHIPCDEQLPCGHRCKELCHPSKLHTRIPCQD